MADAKQSGTVRCVVVTPESTSLDTQARSVTLPLYDGLRGVGRGHSPFIGRLGAGEVRIVGEQGGPADAVRRLFVEGGFVEVSHDAVTVITQRAIAAERIDAAAARADLARIIGTRAAGDEAIEAKEQAAQVARALVRTAGGR
ncbi:MAG: F0F1 ATP synthase subunit epsilon [Planctomycetota bacterium]|jgi:F-type H+-transporting ATPase subunit epsilon|nr:MAG: F0F1 ATP synthase subunit epsilon [Planctomycetota bacterium]